MNDDWPNQAVDAQRAAGAWRSNRCRLNAMRSNVTPFLWSVAAFTFAAILAVRSAHGNTAPAASRRR
jgi:hypothetical protein